MKHCMYCNTLMTKNAIYCPKCGKKQKSINNNLINNLNVDNKNNHQLNNNLTTNQQILIETKVNNESKSIGIAYLLWLFFGWFGAHRFYFNKINGIIMFIIWLFGWIFIYTSLFSLGLILLFVYGLWWIMDAFWIYNAINKNKHNIKLRTIKQINPQYGKHIIKKIKKQKIQNNNIHLKNYQTYIQQNKITPTGIIIAIIIFTILCFIGIKLNGYI